MALRSLAQPCLTALESCSVRCLSVSATSQSNLINFLKNKPPPPKKDEEERPDSDQRAPPTAPPRRSGQLAATLVRKGAALPRPGQHAQRMALGAPRSSLNTSVAVAGG